MGKVSTINNAKTGWQLLRNRKTLWCMIKQAWKGSYRMSFLTSLVIVLGIAYVFIPLDFDWIPVLGWLDDGFVIFLVIKRLQAETQRFIRHKAMERKRDC